MAKALLAISGLISLILIAADPPDDQVFYLTKIIGTALGLSTIAIWLLITRGKEL